MLYWTVLGGLGTMLKVLINCINGGNDDNCVNGQFAGILKGHNGFTNKLNVHIRANLHKCSHG